MKAPWRKKKNKFLKQYKRKNDLEHFKILMTIVSFVFVILIIAICLK